MIKTHEHTEKREYLLRQNTPLGYKTIPALGD